MPEHFSEQAVVQMPQVPTFLCTTPAWHQRMSWRSGEVRNGTWTWTAGIPTALICFMKGIRTLRAIAKEPKAQAPGPSQ